MAVACQWTRGRGKSSPRHSMLAQPLTPTQGSLQRAPLPCSRVPCTPPLCLRLALVQLQPAQKTYTGRAAIPLSSEHLSWLSPCSLTLGQRSVSRKGPSRPRHTRSSGPESPPYSQHCYSLSGTPSLILALALYMSTSSTKHRMPAPMHCPQTSSSILLSSQSTDQSQ